MTTAGILKSFTALFLISGCLLLIASYLKTNPDVVLADQNLQMKAFDPSNSPAATAPPYAQSVYTSGYSQSTYNTGYTDSSYQASYYGQSTYGPPPCRDQDDENDVTNYRSWSRDQVDGLGRGTDWQNFAGVADFYEYIQYKEIPDVDQCDRSHDLSGPT